MHVKKKTKILILGIIVVIIGVMIEVIPIFLKKEDKKIEDTKINNFILETSIKNKDDDEKAKEENNSANEDSIEEDNYLMILEIPKINLKKGIYSFNSYLNSIEYNIAIMEGSSLPDAESNNLILAAHNGTAKISYFNQLHKIGIGDKANIYYHGIKYTYAVDYIYDVRKDGDVEIKRDLNKNTLTLVTCKKDTNDRQLIIILYLLNKEEY